MASTQSGVQWSAGNVASNGQEHQLFTESLSTVLADLIARMKGTDPTENGFRLYEYIDPEAVDDLHAHSRRKEDSSWRLEFDTGAETVIVRSDGFIRVRRDP